MSDFNFEVMEQLGELGESRGYVKEVNIISFNNREPKLDIRTWKKGKILKSISLSDTESKKLLRILQEWHSNK